MRMLRDMNEEQMGWENVFVTKGTICARNHITTPYCTRPVFTLLSHSP